MSGLSVRKLLVVKMKNKKCIGVFVGIVLLILILCFLPKAAWKLEQNSPKKMTVCVQTDNGSGNGVVWEIQEEKSIILTAAHVVGGTLPQTVRINNKEYKVSEYSYISDIYDLAFLEIDMSADKKLVQVKRNTEVIDTVAEKDEIYSIAFVDNKIEIQKGEVLSSWIYMDDFGYHMMWAKFPCASGGMSGSGVYDKEDQLLGILVGGSQAGEVAVVPLVLIEREWKHYNMQ